MVATGACTASHALATLRQPELVAWLLWPRFCRGAVTAYRQALVISLALHLIPRLGLFPAPIGSKRLVADRGEDMSAVVVVLLLLTDGHRPAVTDAHGREAVMIIA